MLHLHLSQRTEDLLAVLAQHLAQQRGSLRERLQPTRLIVPNHNMERFVEYGLAQQHGVAANLQFWRLERFVAEWLRAAGVTEDILDRQWMEAFLLDRLLDVDTLPATVAAPVKHWLAQAGNDSVALQGRRVQLANHLARLFEEYSFSRAAMVRDWETRIPTSGTAAWQAELWRAVRARAHAQKPTPLLAPWEAVAQAGAQHKQGAPLHFFGVSYVSHGYRAFLTDLSASTDLHMYVLDPAGGVANASSPFLDAWGTPQREFVDMLRSIPHTQHAVTAAGARVHVPIGTEDAPTIRLIGCASPRREAEGVADLIWSLMREPRDNPLHFNDIAVLVNASQKDIYLPHVASVFDEAHRIPHSVTDVPLLSASPVAQAVLALLELPFSRFKRSVMLDFLMHPNLAGLSADADRHAFVRVVDRLGIFHGADHSDHEDTYITSDVINWRQGMRRVALGAFMEGPTSGESEPVVAGEEAYLPEEAREDRPSIQQLMLIARSLMEDMRSLPEENTTHTGWSERLASLVTTYLCSHTDEDEAHLQRCLAGIYRLARLDTHGKNVGFGTALALARSSIEALSGASGGYLMGGVTVSTMAPMRAIPFRVIIVMGMTEGKFPAQERLDALDLKQAARQPGDVNPLQRDQSMFLETLLCARDQVVFTYVSRDPQTGEDIHPSSTVQQLLHLLEQHHGFHAKDLTSRQPLRRHQTVEKDGPAATVLDGAHKEAQARLVGMALRKAAGGALRVGHPAQLRAASGEAWPDVVALLKLPKPPPPVRAESFTRARRINVYALRKFLECPLQGWATHVLGMEEDEEDLSRLDDEPMTAETLAQYAVIRRVVMAELRKPGSWDAALEKESWREQRAGRWPVGALQRAPWPENLPDTWLRALRGEDQQALKVSRVTFSQPEFPDDEHDVQEPIPVRLEDGRQCLITGTLEPIITESGALVLTRLHRAYDELAIHKTLLRACVNQMLLTAAGVNAPLLKKAVFCGLDKEGQPTSRTIAVTAPTKKQAHNWLSAMAEDLMGQAHAYFLPVDAVLKGGGVRDSVYAALVAMRLDEKAGSSAYGPVPGALDYPLPDKGQLDAILTRRFAPLLQLQQGGAA